MSIVSDMIARVAALIWPNLLPGDDDLPVAAAFMLDETGVFHQAPDLTIGMRSRPAGSPLRREGLPRDMAEHLAQLPRDCMPSPIRDAESALHTHCS